MINISIEQAKALIDALNDLSQTSGLYEEDEEILEMLEKEVEKAKA